LVASEKDKEKGEKIKILFTAVFWRWTRRMTVCLHPDPSTRSLIRGEGVGWMFLFWEVLLENYARIAQPKPGSSPIGLEIHI
jgi:hypothetical protein